MRTHDGYPLFIGNEKYINDQRFELVSRRYNSLSESVGVKSEWKKGFFIEEVKYFGLWLSGWKTMSKCSSPSVAK